MSELLRDSYEWGFSKGMDAAWDTVPTAVTEGGVDVAQAYKAGRDDGQEIRRREMLLMEERARGLYPDERDAGWFKERLLEEVNTRAPLEEVRLEVLGELMVKWYRAGSNCGYRWATDGDRVFTSIGWEDPFGWIDTASSIVWNSLSGKEGRDA